MKKPPLPLGLAPQIGAIGLQPFESRNIRLSSALCALGFALNHASEPATVVVDFDKAKACGSIEEAKKHAVVSFWHAPLLPEDSLIRKQLPKLTAFMVGMWWSDPTKYSIDGYDDALHAMRRVFESREWLIKVAKGCSGVSMSADGRLQRATVTESLHIASVIKASGEDLVAYSHASPARTGTFVFAAKASRVASLIDEAENAKASGQQIEARTSENISLKQCEKKPGTGPEEGASPLVYAPARPAPDPCIDWMLWALKYGDWLRRIVRQRDCIPLIEKRDGERLLRISSQMPKTLRREFTRRF